MISGIFYLSNKLEYENIRTLSLNMQFLKLELRVFTIVKINCKMEFVHGVLLSSNLEIKFFGFGIYQKKLKTKLSVVYPFSNNYQKDISGKILLANNLESKIYGKVYLSNNLERKNFRF